MSTTRQRKTDASRCSQRGQGDQAGPESRVDPAALGLAAVAAGISVLSGAGDWDLMGTVLGLVLLPVVVAYHRLPLNAGRWRQRLMKLAFSGVAAQILILILGWPVQHLLVEPLQLTHSEWLQWATSTDRSFDDPPAELPVDRPPSPHEDRALAPDAAASALLGMFWFLMVGAIYWAEPRLMAFLDRDPHDLQSQRGASSPLASAPPQDPGAVKHGRETFRD